MNGANEPRINVAFPVQKNQVTTGITGQLPGTRSVTEYDANPTNAARPVQNGQFVGTKRPSPGGEPPISVPRTSQGFVPSANRVPQISTAVNLTSLVSTRFGASVTGVDNQTAESVLGISPLGTRADPAGMVWNGIPMEPPPQFRSFPTYENLPVDDLASRIALASNSSPDQRQKYTITVSKKALHFAAYELKGFPMVAETQAYDGEKKTYAGYAQPGIPANIYDIVSANLVMAVYQTKPTDFTQVASVSDMMKMFRIMGICETDSGDYSGPFGERRAAGHRNLVLTLGGVTNCAINMYGDKLKYGHTVGFILKGVPRKSIYVDSAFANGTYQLDPKNPNTKISLPPTVPNVILQYVPWSGMAPAPSPSELAYKDDFGVERIGAFVPMGIFYQYHHEVGDFDAIDRAVFSKSAAVSAGACVLLLTPKLSYTQAG